MPSVQSKRFRPFGFISALVNSYLEYICFLLMNLPVIFLMAKVDIRLPLVNAGMQQFPLPYLVYGGKVKTTSIYVRDFINISYYALLLFGGSLNPSNMGEGIEMVGGYLYFSAPKRIIGLIQIGHWFRLHVCRVILNF